MARRSAAYQPQSQFCVKFFILLLIAAFSAASIYFYNQVTTLYSQVGQDEHDITYLQSRIKAQQLIIDRFNQSVTNADVQHKVEDLEGSLRSTQTEMLKSLDATKHNIEKLLNETVLKLDTTVSAAQADIQNEVNIVKGDVEQYVRTTQDQFSMENSFMVYQLAGTFTLLACLISMWHMTGHVRRFKRPFVQRKILAILWMSPIYGITSWLSLIFPQYEGYLAIVKDFYEAYVIYQFLSFLVSVLGRGDRDTVVDLLAKHADHLEPPKRCFGWCRGKYLFTSQRALADAVLMQCQAFTMQFVFFKPITAVGTFVCNKIGYFGQGTSSGDYRSPQFWFNIIQNISIFVAFSGLLKFYHLVQDDLSWCRPFPKFLCIKGIVFMTFWQGLVISFLADSTSIAGDKDADPEIWGRQAQNFLICLEMLLFSIAHFYCFPTEEWQEGYRISVEKKMSAGDNLALGDFISDLKLIMSGNDKYKKKKKQKVDADETMDEDRSSPLLALDEEKETAQNDEEHGLGSGSDEASGNIPESTLTEGVEHNIIESATTGDEEENELDTSNQSINMEKLSTFESSVEDAILNPDADIRQAANRLRPLMAKIKEESESERFRIYEKLDGSPLENNSIEDSLENSIGDSIDAEYHDTGQNTAEFQDTSQPINTSTYGAFDDNNTEFPAKESDVENVGTSTEAAPSETTSLLGGDTKDASDVQLRPSIFTSHLE